jgi:uncharacterized protein YdhG (YjbR/CyaY superfamily)
MGYIDEYLSQLNNAKSVELLQSIRKIIHELIEDVDEIKSYGIPTFKYRSKNLIHFAAYENHLSIYPGSHAIEVFSKELADFKISKGTVQFTVEKPISTALIKKIILLRKQEIDKG